MQAATSSMELRQVCSKKADAGQAMAMIRSVMQVRSSSFLFQMVFLLGPATSLRTSPIIIMFISSEESGYLQYNFIEIMNNTLAAQICHNFSSPHERGSIADETRSSALCNPSVQKCPALALTNRSSSKINSFRVPPLSPAHQFGRIPMEPPAPKDMGEDGVQNSRKKDLDLQMKNKLQQQNSMETGPIMANVGWIQGQSYGARARLDVAEFKCLSNKLDSIQSRIAQMRRELDEKKEKRGRSSVKKIKNEKTKSCATLDPVNSSDVIENQQAKLIESQQSSPLKQAVLAQMVVQAPRPQQYQKSCSNSIPPEKYYISELLSAYKDQKSLARAHLVCSLNIFRTLERRNKPSQEEIQLKKINLPCRQGFEHRKTIVFDLDETLIHCNQPKCKRLADVLLPVQLSSKQIVQVGINIRPHVWELLSELVKHFELMVFTASHRSYADAVIDYIDPQQQFFHHRLYRQHCTLTPQDVYIKDLRIINRPLQNILLVDNAAYSYAWQLENGVPILPYYEGQHDFELKALKEYLLSLVGKEQIVEANRSYFKLHHYKDYLSAPNKLVEALYTKDSQLS